MDGFRESKTNRNDVEEKKIILEGLFSWIFGFIPHSRHDVTVRSI
jgi:hypothetical protein